MTDSSLPVIKTYTEEDKKKALQSAIFHMSTKDIFIGGLLQELTIKYNDLLVPTAGITFNAKLDQYEIYLNSKFFCGLPTTERTAILQHEILHFTNKHLFRLPFGKAQDKERQMYNLAGDMAINQFITDLPKGCIDVKEWTHTDPKDQLKKPFPLHESIETYYELIKNNQEENKEKLEGKGGNGEGKAQTLDQHMWDELDEEGKQKLIDAAKKIIKRTIEKTSTSYDNIPGGIKDLLQELETLSTNLNYKQILKNTIKKTVCCTDREGTWNRPNKRVGFIAPGTKVGQLPMCSFYLDSSGSISITELNQFLHIMSNFLKVGSRNCMLNLWHTELYYKKKYRLHGEVDRDSVQSGGTSVQCVLEDIKKTNPNLSLIITDGYYDRCDVKLNQQIIWIISENGTTEHPLRHIGKTIPIKSIR